MNLMQKTISHQPITTRGTESEQDTMLGENFETKPEFCGGKQKRTTELTLICDLGAVDQVRQVRLGSGGTRSEVASVDADERLRR